MYIDISYLSLNKVSIYVVFMGDEKMGGGEQFSNTTFRREAKIVLSNKIQEYI